MNRVTIDMIPPRLREGITLIQPGDTISVKLTNENSHIYENAFSEHIEKRNRSKNAS